LPTREPQSVVWNPADYAANSAAQLAWARELITKLHLHGNERILDVGCGDGKVTAELARAVPQGVVTGVDSSAEMIRFASTAFPQSRINNLKFKIADARELNTASLLSPSPPLPMEERAGVRRRSIPNSKPLTPTLSPLGRGEGDKTTVFDVVFSNATLHWVDDHQAFLRGAAACLRSGGRLLVSCGGKGNAQEVFSAIRPEMRLRRWREFFCTMPAPYFFHAPEDYEKWLPRFSFKTVGVRLTPKDALHEGRDGFAAWFRTTWMPYTQRVPEDLRAEFIAAVTERYLAKHPLDAAGKIHVQMVRLEIDAVKS
jgi:trans-aconitate 2-methyltransferase